MSYITYNKPDHTLIEKTTADQIFDEYISISINIVMLYRIFSILIDNITIIDLKRKEEEEIAYQFDAWRRQTFSLDYPTLSRLGRILACTPRAPGVCPGGIRLGRRLCPDWRVTCPAAA